MDEGKIYVLDRIEEGRAVCEEIGVREILVLQAGDIPEGAREGDVIRRLNGGFVIDSAKTRERESEIGGLFSKLRK